MTHPLVKLQQLGQSPWLDNIRRELLSTGKLAAMIADGEITGLTSNPTIFEQAIGQSNDYDEQLVRLARAGKSAGDIFDQLASEDIRQAAGLFHDTWQRAGRRDGFVSIEVSPRLAQDTAATTAEAARLWKLIDRPNLLVKIPATKAGLPAIEQSIADGISINVTLIFSLARYSEVIDAFQAGIRRRVAERRDVSQIASVASFFVSRVDTAIDAQLDQKIAAGGAESELEPLKGKAAIANAKLAYQLFLERFSSPAWAELERAGAQKQRPLWASTSTKNPAYPDIYYVEALVGPNTVDTMPPHTLAAYKDHGRPEARLTNELDQAHATLAALARAGIDMAQVTRKLEEEGVASFTKSFDSLLQTVDKRRAAVKG